METAMSTDNLNLCKILLQEAVVTNNQKVIKGFSLLIKQLTEREKDNLLDYYVKLCCTPT